MPYFSSSSKEKLTTCHISLQLLFYEVIKYEDCTILCGWRSKEAQFKAFKSGTSKVVYPNSKHNYQPSNAVDVVPYPIAWGDTNRFLKFGGFVMGVANQMSIKIVWGGNWKSFVDMPHYELTNPRSIGLQEYDSRNVIL